MSRSWTRQFWSSNFEDHNSYLWNLSWYHYDFSICKIIFAIYGPQIHMYLCRTFVFNLLLNVIYFAIIFDVFLSSKVQTVFKIDGKQRLLNIPHNNIIHHKMYNRWIFWSNVLLTGTLKLCTGKEWKMIFTKQVLS